MSKHLYTSYLPYLLWLPLSRKNISSMNYVQSSPGFDPFSTSFIKHAEKTIQDDRGKRHTENVPLPLLTCSICFCQTVSPHIFGTKLKSRLYTRKVQLRPPKLSSAGYQWLYLQTFCKRGQGLIDGLGSCWTPNTRLSIWFLPHKEHQPTPLYSSPHSRAC